MAQGKYKKSLNKKVRKGNKGYPIATVAYYGPTNVVATKLVCAIIKYDGAEAEPMEKWFSENDVRKSEKILGEVLAFIEENEVSTISMTDKIMGCPHEEGIDYPEGEPCQKCSYWNGRDRLTHEMLH
ncbi:MAG: hypothetical protein COB30_006115 [Ectothiorhodospiraceae bacterium]|nr:hypothetical protein [Ectothiorhodospiraceae bacterium]